MKPYATYAAEELALDDMFMRWVQYPDDDEIDCFWQGFSNQHPYRQLVIAEARRMVLEGSVPLRGTLTHDELRYDDELWWRQQRPEVAMGSGSWRWVERAYASMRALAAPGVLERVTIPAIVLATPHDRLVGWRAIERAARRMTRAQLVQFGPEARHEILREADPVRAKALRLIDAFLDQVVPEPAKTGP